jgi:hypothetical protein
VLLLADGPFVLHGEKRKRVIGSGHDGVLCYLIAASLLVLSYLQHFLGLKDEHTHAALKSSIELADKGKNILSFRS